MKTRPYEGVRARLRMVTGCCPAQWEGVTEGGQYVYVRFRWGRLRVGISDTEDGSVDNCETVYREDSTRGIMSTEEMLDRTGFVLTGEPEGMTTSEKGVLAEVQREVRKLR